MSRRREILRVQSLCKRIGGKLALDNFQMSLRHQIATAPDDRKRALGVHLRLNH